VTGAEPTGRRRVHFGCDCEGTVVAVFCDGATPRATCATCERTHALSPKSQVEGGGLVGCVCCGHPELFARKDFPRALGFTILGVAAVLAPFTYYISLGAAALLDLGLYHVVPEVLVCYVCNAEHRGFPNRPRHPRYDPEIADRVRFGAKAVMGKPMRVGGTADAPDPEH
jgi:hypothetical protein